jgi:hypothetical protein
MESPAEVDVVSLETHLTTIHARFKGAWNRWVAQRLFVNIVLAYLVFVIIPAALAGEFAHVFDLEGRRIWTNLVGPLAFAIVITAWSVWYTRRQVVRGPQQTARSIEREVRTLTGPHWLRRVLMIGLGMGAAIGIPIGALVAFTAPAGLSLGSRMLAVFTFTAMTLLWTIPIAFAIRWVTLRTHQRFIRPAS